MSRRTFVTPKSSSACSARTSRSSRRSRASRARRGICARAWDAPCASVSRRSSPFTPMRAWPAPPASRLFSSRSAMAASPPTRSPSTEGLVLVDKPAGVTSHDVVAVARRALRERRIGHAGTLDPFATGLLVLLVGRATRLLPYLSGEPKVYEASIRFGFETSTDDLTGEPTVTAPPPALDAVRAALPSLTGALRQLPPAYSAKQVAGERAYDAARRGAPLALATVPVTVHAWNLGAFRDGELDAT